MERLACASSCAGHLACQPFEVSKTPSSFVRILSVFIGSLRALRWLFLISFRSSRSGAAPRARRASSCRFSRLEANRPLRDHPVFEEKYPENLETPTGVGE